MKTVMKKMDTDELSAIISESVQQALANAGLNSGSLAPKKENDLMYFSRRAINEWLIGNGRITTEQEMERFEKEKARYAHEANRIWHHYHEDIYTLNKSFLTNIGSYFFKEKMPTKALLNDTVYFDMKPVSVIYTECNNEQFEEMAEIDFYSVLNGQPATHPMKIKVKEKIRTCYLLHKLYELLPAEKKEKWLNCILSILGISKNFYLSKYKEAASEYANEKSFAFAKKNRQNLYHIILLIIYLFILSFTQSKLMYGRFTSPYRKHSCFRV